MELFKKEIVNTREELYLEENGKYRVKRSYNVRYRGGHHGEPDTRGVGYAIEGPFLPGPNYKKTLEAALLFAENKLVSRQMHLSKELEEAKKKVEYLTQSLSETSEYLQEIKRAVAKVEDEDSK